MRISCSPPHEDGGRGAQEERCGHGGTGAAAPAPLPLPHLAPLAPQLIVLSDLENDFMNPHDAARKLNRFVVSLSRGFFF